jgi:dipeptidyl aminopeptidase/acylaminoacyl peptidase
MALVMDVFSPKGDKNGAGVILVMGGGMNSSPTWSHGAGNRDDVQNLLQAGYVIFATAHSSQPKYRVDEIAKDIPRAVRFIRYNVERFKIEPQRIGIMGHSSGAQIGLLAAVDPPPANIESADPIERVSANIQAVVAYYPGTDMVNFGHKNTTIVSHFKSIGYNLDAPFDFHQWDDSLHRFERVVDPETQLELFRQNSPITFVTANDPAVFLLHGDQDKVVPIQQSELMVVRLKDLGVPYKLRVMVGQGHGWRTPIEGELEEVLKWFDQYLLNK